MRKNFGAKSYLYPKPVLIIATYGEDGTPDAMNAAWGCIADTDQIAMYLSGAQYETACDYVGLVSAKNVPDKVARAGFHTTRSQFVDAPLIDELPMALECRLISFDEDSELLLGRIVNASADESILDGAGQIDPDKLRPITYDSIHRTYRVLGEVVGQAYSDGKKLQ